MFFLTEICENSNFLQIVQVIWNIIHVFCIVIPILLILMVSIDFAKNVISGSEEITKKNLQIILKRIISSVAVFLAPIIVRFSLSLLGNIGVPYVDCINNATTEKIEYFKQLESAQREQEEQANSSSQSNSDNNTNNSSNEKTENTVDTTGLNLSTDFTKINQCNQRKVIATVNGVKLRECVIGYKTSFFQGIAITDDYVYFSRLSTLKKDNKIVNQNKVVRISRSSNKYQVMYVNYAGHAQCFDVASKYKDGQDQVFLNYFTNYKSGSVPKHTNNGVTYCSFNGKAKDSGAKKIPETAIAILSNDKKTPKSLKLVNVSDYKKSNGEFDSTTYNKLVEKIGMSDSSYLQNAQIAVDEDHNQLVLYTSTGEVYVYKLSNFVNGKLSLINHFSTGSGYGQGVEIYGNYFYFYRAFNPVIVRKFDIRTGKKVADLTFSFNQFLQNHNLSSGGEAEGITVYKGKVYIGFFYKGNNTTYAGIFYVDGI